MIMKAYHLLRVLRFPIHVDHLLIGWNEKYRTILIQRCLLTGNKFIEVSSLVTYAFGT